MNGTSFPPSLFQIAAEALMANPGWLDEAVGEDEASRVTNTPPATLQTMRVRGGGPPFVKRGARVSYIRRDLFQWLTVRRRSSTSDTFHSAESAISRIPNRKGEEKDGRSSATPLPPTEHTASDDDESITNALAKLDSDGRGV